MLYGPAFIPSPFLEVGPLVEELAFAASLKRTESMRFGFVKRKVYACKASLFIFR